MMIRTHISFPPETLIRMDKIAGEKGRAEFVRNAVERYLDLIEEAYELGVKSGKSLE